MQSLEVTVEPFDESRWPEVLQFADSVVPYDREGNRVWLANRQEFAASGRIRRHYAAMDAARRMVAYGAIEQQADDRVYRLFIVPSAARLLHTAGDALFGRLAADLRQVGATLVWMREYARDVELIRFAEGRGFQHGGPFDYSGPGGTVRLVHLEMRLA